jgi:hypothetical protein
MKWYIHILVILASIIPTSISHAASAVDTLIEEYRSQGTTQFNADTGKKFWNQSFMTDKSPESRRCASCHTANPDQPGKHIRTGKLIKPLAPSANSERLSDIRKVRKWFKRNCQWTLGRECTPQEKGNVLLYLNNL